jgi:hypothetical protein
MNRRSVLFLASQRMAGLALLQALPHSAWALSLSSTDASAALRAALDRGAKLAVEQLGKPDGFLSNDKVRIGLPDVLEKAAPVLRTMGQGRRLDELTTAMNHGQQFQPVVNQAVAKVDLAKRYNDVANKASQLGLIPGQAVTVQDHITQKALDGLYFVIGEEERRIRNDPVGTGSALLKKVFGAL